MSAIDKIRKKIISKEYEFAIPHFFEEMAQEVIRVYKNEI